MMTDALLDELAAARRERTPCALITMAETKGSVRRAAQAKMLVYVDGLTSGAIGGGKFEALAIADALVCLREKRLGDLLETLPAEVTRESTASAAEFIASRNHELDRDALASAVRVSSVGYLGMIGARKVRQVFKHPRAGNSRRGARQGLRAGRA
jgi:xanthine/CO dehydrogenase XdhC/CoxF family maturation factor